MNDATAQTAPALPVYFKPLDELIPYARNSVDHSEADEDALAAAIMEFGYTKPILADEKGIVAGHRRKRALAKLFAAGKQPCMVGGTPIPHNTAPVIDCSGWSPAQRQAYIIWDNQSAAAPMWNQFLKVELRELADNGFALELTGFNQDELGDIFGAEKVKEPNPDNEDVGGDRYLVLIECADEAQQQQLFTEFQERGLSCKIS